ncbi:hypothetical protein HDU97_002269 [Phlyctochytrium planicorne]|nr:hypothetical protein HDU97_002269 [Phlyctochytrium planicorne]
MDSPGAELPNTTLAALVSAFAVNGALAILFVTGFIILRPRFPQTYAPRTNSVPEKWVASSIKTNACRHRSPELPATHFGFLQAFWTSDINLLTRLGPDAYATILFTQTLAILFLGLGILSCVVLLPIHVYGGNHLEGLDALTFGNVMNASLLWVHFGVLAIVTGATIHTIFRLISATSRLRQHYQSSSDRSRSIAARTLLVRDVTREIRTPLEIARLFDRITPGSVHSVVIPRRVSAELSTLVLKRGWKQGRLEGAITKFICSSAEKAEVGHSPQGTSTSFEEAVESVRIILENEQNMNATYSRGINEPPSPDENRPVHKKLLFCGETLDAIRYYSDQLRAIQDRLEVIRDAKGILDVEEVSTAPPTAANLEAIDVVQQSHNLAVDATDAAYFPIAFVFFNDILSTHIAASAVIHDAPAGISERHPCVDVEDVLWENMPASYLERQSRNSIAYACFIVLLISWSALIGFIRGFAEPEALVRLFPALKSFFEYSPELTGVISGVLPQIVISALLVSIPFVLRFLNIFAGSALATEVERKVHEQFFFFLVFNLFFVVTLSGTLISIWSIIAQILKDPSSIFFELAEIIPKSANFFTNYIMLAGLSGPTVDLLQLAPLVVSPIIVYFFGSTPRMIHGVMQPIPFRYAEIVSYHSFFAVLGLIYCTISPLLVIMVALYFGIYYFVYVYQLQYIFVHPFESGGKLLYTASQQLYVGLYVMQILMIGLFGLREAYIQAGLTLLVFGLTAWCMSQSKKFKRLIDELPVKTALDADDLEALGQKSSVYFSAPPTILSRFLPGLLSAIEMPEELQGLVRDREPPKPFEFPDKAQLVADFAHPNAGAGQLKIWVPSTSLESVMEAVKVDVARIPDTVLVTEGAAVDSTGRVKLSPAAIAWTDV